MFPNNKKMSSEKKNLEKIHFSGKLKIYMKNGKMMKRYISDEEFYRNEILKMNKKLKFKILKRDIVKPDEDTSEMGILLRKYFSRDFLTRNMIQKILEISPDISIDNLIENKLIKSTEKDKVLHIPYVAIIPPHIFNEEEEEEFVDPYDEEKPNENDSCCGTFFHVSCIEILKEYKCIRSDDREKYYPGTTCYNMGKYSLYAHIQNSWRCWTSTNITNKDVMHDLTTKIYTRILKRIDRFISKIIIKKHLPDILQEHNICKDVGKLVASYL